MKKTLFTYWSDAEKNEPDFWKDRGIYNIGEMIEMAVETTGLDKTMVSVYVEEFIRLNTKHTLKYWRTEQDFDNGEAQDLSTQLSLEDALDVYRAFIRIGRHYAMEIYETESGETIEHTHISV